MNDMAEHTGRQERMGRNGNQETAENRAQEQDVSKLAQVRREKLEALQAQVGDTGKTVEECYPAGGNCHGIDSFSYVPVRKIRRPSLIRVMEAASMRGADIGSADVIVAGGNGAGPEGFALIQELADLLEVIYAAASARGSSPGELEQIRVKKAQERGSFNRKILLKEVMEN